MINIHKTKPTRTFSKVLKNYTSYRPYLKNDFNYSCGYCGDSDKFYGHYHIDHFKPQGNVSFSHLHNDYNNLVYACPFCNLSKSDTWLITDGFIDPCHTDYDTHLKRKNNGKIIPLTANGKNMYRHFKLYLLRHELIWIIEKVKEQKDELLSLKDSCTIPDEKLRILEKFVELQNFIDNYTRLYVE